MAPAAAKGLQPIDRAPTAGLIADQLREAIMSGDFAQGVQLGEADLAGRFGVSRGPVREAMQRLVQEGLLHSIRHRGLFVTELTATDIRDIYAARTAVESAAVTLIVADEPERSAAALSKAVGRMAAAVRRRDSAALSRSDLAFHELLVAESRSPRLRRMASTLLVETRMCLSALPPKYVAPSELTTEHAEIVDAVARADRDRALALLEAHMQDAVERLTQHHA
ncbi:MAG: FCD domain-containing protein [Streptosporangiales bacterium]|nr:FCD domain-containing protein [Streptosporangiales bacterium]